MIFEGYSIQKEIAKKEKKKNKDFTKPPFVYPTDTADLHKYRNHVEITPPVVYRPMINEFFYPVLGEKRPETHPSMRDKHLTMGVYGAYCIDCNHNCHPETHPYEWLWWLNLDKEPSNSKIWMIGLMKEASNRFPNWVKGDRTGSIAIPFIIPEEKEALQLKWEHLVFSKTVEENLPQLPDLPESALNMNFDEMIFNIKGNMSTEKQLILCTNFPLIEKGIKCWIGKLNYDQNTGHISGKLHIGISVEQIYLAKITAS